MFVYPELNACWAVESLKGISIKGDFKKILVSEVAENLESEAATNLNYGLNRGALNFYIAEILIVRIQKDQRNSIWLVVGHEKD